MLDKMCYEVWMAQTLVSWNLRSICEDQIGLYKTAWKQLWAKLQKATAWEVHRREKALYGGRIT